MAKRKREEPIDFDERPVQRPKRTRRLHMAQEFPDLGWELSASLKPAVRARLHRASKPWQLSTAPSANPPKRRKKKRAAA